MPNDAEILDIQEYHDADGKLYCEVEIINAGKFAFTSFTKEIFRFYQDDLDGYDKLATYIEDEWGYKHLREVKNLTFKTFYKAFRNEKD